MIQLQLLQQFDGVTYGPTLDRDRLTSQLDRVKALMIDGKWRSLANISQEVRGSEAGVSARLRDLRKPRFGGYTVNRRRVEGGLWMYQLSA